MNFEIFTKENIGVNIGKWIDKIHKDDSVKPSYIGNHYVGGASNAWESVD